MITEKDFLREYNPTIFKRPNTSVDTVIFTVLNQELNVLLVKRAEPPFKEFWSLVGGYIDLELDDTLESTAKRKLIEKTGVAAPYLEQLATIGGKDRDPRGWSVTTIYFALIPSDKVILKPGSGALDTKWARIKKGKVRDKLAFDHSEILDSCINRLRSKVLYTSLPVHLVPRFFTLGDLQKVYEIIVDKKIDHKSFRRRMLAADFLEETTSKKKESGRPALLYTIKKNHLSHTFSRNIEGAV
jgi:8-oxo-dGTP diphosphatase